MQSFSLEFNTLDLFDLRHVHSVTPGGAHARNSRLPVSG